MERARSVLGRFCGGSRRCCLLLDRIRLEQACDVVEEARVEPTDVEQDTDILLSECSLTDCFLHVIFCFDKFFLLIGKVFLELLDGVFALVQVRHTLVELRVLLVEEPLLSLDLFFCPLGLLHGLLEFPVRARCRHLGVLEVRLQLIVARSQLLDLLELLGLHHALLLPLISELVEQLLVVGLSHA